MVGFLCVAIASFVPSSAAAPFRTEAVARATNDPTPCWTVAAKNDLEGNSGGGDDDGGSGRGMILRLRPWAVEARADEDDPATAMVVTVVGKIVGRVVFFLEFGTSRFFRLNRT